MAYTSPSSSAAIERERTTSVQNTWRRPVIIFVLLFAAVWLLLYVAYVALPFTQPGSVVIVEAKFKTMVTEPMFGPQDRNRVMIFGNSRALASVLPRKLDADMGPGFRSYNLGLPGEIHFLPILEAALQAGNVPSHVLLTVPWDAKVDQDSWRDSLRDDATIARSLLPFRTFPRDITLFIFQNRHRLAQAVHDVAAERDGVLEERGWYFIKSQSHYADDRLPDDYALPTDRPALVDKRKIPEKSFTRARLEQLATQYGFQILFIPVPVRKGEFAPAPSVDDVRLATVADHPRARIIGPDYFSYPAAFFADPVHMNPRGAEAYTADLARLLKASSVLD